jgi:hypothetical protein
LDFHIADERCSGEQGKVDESMREMAAIEALKTEKADKEVCFSVPNNGRISNTVAYHSGSCNS